VTCSRAERTRAGPDSGSRASSRPWHLAHDLIDEYRLLVFPLVLGEGTRLFPDCTAPVNLALVSAQTTSPAVHLIYTRPGCR
jgi:riboflavin biosynthesis pyrimidine reductase